MLQSVALGAAPAGCFAIVAIVGSIAPAVLKNRSTTSDLFRHVRRVGLAIAGRAPRLRRPLAHGAFVGGCRDRGHQASGAPSIRPFRDVFAVLFFDHDQDVDRLTSSVRPAVDRPSPRIVVVAKVGVAWALARSRGSKPGHSSSPGLGQIGSSARPRLDRLWPGNHRWRMFTAIIAAGGAGIAASSIAVRLVLCGGVVVPSRRQEVSQG
jgi:hypothetical protein